MRRADRLFQLIQYLRGRGGVVTAQAIADNAPNFALTDTQRIIFQIDWKWQGKG